MRPIQHLPMPMPKDYDPGPKFFYENFVKQFIPDMIQMMSNGMHIDKKAVEELRAVIEEVQTSIYERIEKSEIINDYRKSRLPKLQKEHYEKATKSVRDYTYYLTNYKPADMVHRTWVINTYLGRKGKARDKKEKWSVKDLKQYNIFFKDNLVSEIIAKRPLSANKYVVEGMRELAKYKADMWNKVRYENAETPVPLPDFNPNSSLQIKELFEMLEIEPLAFSPDTGEASWGREQIEQVQKEVTDEAILDVLEILIDNSFSAIIKNNFLKAFDTFTVDGVLHGNIVLFGAKSFRNTSNSPNLLNMPSTKSIYAKPLKKCFVTGDDDYLVFTADLSALEDREIANLSGDENKQNVFIEGLDGHSLNACGYYKNDLEKIMGVNTNNVDYVKRFMALVEEENKAICDFRQKGKGPTFKLAYGGFPDAHKGGVITQEIFDNYHGILYPGITDYRENYVLKTAQEQGYIHLGLGCRMYASNPSDSIRTLHNATIQFWSILTLIAINELHHRIREEKLEKYIQVNSTIYDSIYTRTYRDPEIIQWLNKNLIEVMTVQHLENEVVPNEAEGELGKNWADLHKVKNNASVDDIKEVLKIIYDKNGKANR